MADFEVKVYEATIEPHPNADALELARIGDYLSCVRKDQFKTGDRVAYIPEQAVVPEATLKELGLEGKLAGKEKNRVKAIKLRGVLSQGIVYPAKEHWNIGDDVAEELGITKYEPPIPVHLAGDVQKSPYKLSFDIENIKKYPHVLKEGEQVIFTEKIHGSCMLTCLVPEPDRHSEMIENKLVVISKGLGKQQLFFKDNEKNATNSYVRVAKQYDLANRLESLFKSNTEPVWLLGELYGVQDLKYGLSNGDLGFRIFGVKIGKEWQDWDEVTRIASSLDIETVPILYRGSFSKEVLEYYTNGKESVSGQEAHVREGIVVYPEKERYDEEIGRVVLKSVSENYLLRKDGTEFN